MRLVLTDEDVTRVQRCAQQRLDDALALKMEDRFHEDSFDSHWWGAAGELLVARHLNVVWRASSREGARTDVGRYEVRAIRPETSPYVKTKDNDPPYRPIAVVRFVSNREGDVLGWTTGAVVREFGQRKDPGNRGAPAWFLEDLSLLELDFPELRPPDAPGPRRFPIIRTPDGKYEYRP